MVGRARASRAPVPDPQWTAALTPVVGPAVAAGAQALGASVSGQYNSGRQDQGSLSLGARWDVNAQVALKLQADVIHVNAYGGGLWGYNTAAPHHASVLSAGMDFVF